MNTLIFGFSTSPNKVKKETIGKKNEMYKMQLYVFLFLNILCQGGFTINANTNIIVIIKQNLFKKSIICLVYCGSESITANVSSSKNLNFFTNQLS